MGAATYVFLTVMVFKIRSWYRAELLERSYRLNFTRNVPSGWIFGDGNGR